MNRNLLLLIASLITKEILDFVIVRIDRTHSGGMVLAQLVKENLADKCVRVLRRMESIGRLNQLPDLSTHSSPHLDGLRQGERIVGHLKVGEAILGRPVHPQQSTSGWPQARGKDSRPSQSW